MCSFCKNFPLILNIIGLICDIIGAFFIAYEVVRRFEGEIFADTNVDKNNIDPDRDIELADAFNVPIKYSSDYTQTYKNYLTSKDINMKTGLIILVVGFVVQIVSNILQWKN